MGRCYEFGVAVVEGCEHAMVVSAEGGACQCSVCGAHCPGRFEGCEAIVAVPGRVPPLAPEWSTAACRGEAMPVAPPPTNGSSAPSTVQERANSDIETVVPFGVKGTGDRPRSALGDNG